MVAIPLKLPMGWKNYPPLFCTDTEMVVETANKALRSHQPSKQHQLDNRAEAIEPPPAPPLTQENAQLTQNPYLRRPKSKLLAYVDVFVDNFLGIAQGPRHRRRHVCRTLFHALDKVFRPLDRQESNQRKEVLSLKKLDAGDCSWSTCQTMLRLIPMVAIPLTLPMGWKNSPPLFCTATETVADLAN